MYILGEIVYGVYIIGCEDLIAFSGWVVLSIWKHIRNPCWKIESSTYFLTILHTGIHSKITIHDKKIINDILLLSPVLGN